MKKTRFAYIKERRYEVSDITGGWVELTCDGEYIAKLVSFEEARRVIYMYWVNLGVSMEYLEEEDFCNV